MNSSSWTRHIVSWAMTAQANLIGSNHLVVLSEFRIVDFYPMITGSRPAILHAFGLKSCILLVLHTQIFHTFSMSSRIFISVAHHTVHFFKIAAVKSLQLRFTHFTYSTLAATVWTNENLLNEAIDFTAQHIHVNISTHERHIIMQAKITLYAIA